MVLKRTGRVPITRSSVNDLTPYLIPGTPPAEVLAELDAAARALDELEARRAHLTLSMDQQTRSLRIELEEDDERRLLSPSQLFALLAGTEPARS